MPFSFQGFQDKAHKSLEHLASEMGTLRTGRAHSQLLDSVKVEAYGGWMKINELANISVPDPGMIMVSPWDKSLLGTIEKAIASSGINLHPVVDGSIIRIVVPPLTEERRKEMVKMLHQKVELGRVMLRNIRGDIKKEIDEMAEVAGVSEDMIKTDLEMLEKHVKEYMEKIEQMAKDKEKELMTV